MSTQQEHGWLHTIMRQAQIEVLAHAKLMHMSIEEKQMFAAGFDYCSDPTCIWCHGSAQHGEESTIRDAR